MMLCKKAKAIEIGDYERQGFIASRKYDGVRVISDKGVLIGRSGNIYTDKFKEISSRLKAFNVVLDGEIVCDTFQQTQARTLTQDKFKLQQLEQQHPAKFMVFDILELNGENLRQKSLNARLRILGEWYSKGKDILGDCGGDMGVFLVENTPKIANLWEEANKGEWEGIIIKNPFSNYQNNRSADWLKVKRVKSKDLEFEEYTINNAGVRAVSKEGIVCQVSGHHSRKFLEQFNKNGVVVVEVEYLEEFKTGKLRQPICKEVKNGLK